MAGIAPTCGSQENACTSMAPASAAIMPPSAKASMFMRSGLMPAMAAASRSWLTARSALPVQVRCRKNISAANTMIGHCLDEVL